MTPIPPKVREAVTQRSRGLCEFPDCWRRAEHQHHRKLRSQGGSHSVANILALCSSCHLYVHEHPAESYANGWLVRSWDTAS